MKIYWIVFCFLFVSSLFAHNENEITYILQNNEMQVHLTPLTLVDLLKNKYPALKNEGVIPLEDYTRFFEEYINQHVQIKIDERPITFALSKHHFKEHDASLVFSIQNLPENFNVVYVQTDAFTEIYQKASNDFVIDWQQKKHTCHLTKSETSCTVSLNALSNKKTVYWWQASFVGVVLFGAFAFLWYKKVKQSHN